MGGYTPGVLTPLLASAVLCFAAPAEAPQDGASYLAGLSAEVKRRGNILGADYDYEFWHALQRKVSQKALEAAPDKDREFFAWQNAGDALKSMESFSTRLRAVSARGAATTEEVRLFTGDIDAAFGKLNLKDEDLRAFYLDRIPRPGGGRARGGADPAASAALKSESAHIGSSGFAAAAAPEGRAFDGGAERPEFVEQSAVAAKPLGDLKAPDAASRGYEAPRRKSETAEPAAPSPSKVWRSEPALPKIDIFAYKPEGREAARLDSVKWGVGGFLAGTGAALAIGMSAPVWVPVALGAGAVAAVGWAIHTMPEGGWAETWFGPDKKSGR